MGSTFRQGVHGVHKGRSGGAEQASGRATPALAACGCLGLSRQRATKGNKGQMKRHDFSALLGSSWFQESLHNRYWMILVFRPWIFDR